jgi:hypothetical protein
LSRRRPPASRLHPALHFPPFTFFFRARAPAHALSISSFVAMMHGVLPALNSLADRSSALAHLGFSRRTSAHDLYPAFGSNVNTVVILLATIVLVGQALLVLLLVTLLFSQRIGRRNPTLLNVILVSIFAGFPGLLLYARGIFVPSCEAYNRTGSTPAMSSLRMYRQCSV